ncbi:DUF397 domain-containing protein [Streptomyces sp. NBC_00828]|uniref:DUF397 domain-containing protein n=1 Tax=Streptomyces sp. NBC_00828 TaxID=2903678 RepID=UPI003864B46C
MSSYRTEWFKSSYSGQNGECLEARRAPAGLDVRDSTRPHGPALTISGDAWSAFLADAKSRALPGE